MPVFNPETCHDELILNAVPIYTFNPEKDYRKWKMNVRDSLTQVIGEMPEKVPLNTKTEYTKEHEDFHETRYVFTSERNAEVPCHLLVPKTGNGPFPVVVCVQGHSTGMHISLGRIQYEKDRKYVKEDGTLDFGDRDFAIQAVRAGYAAMVLEQRCFGERKGKEGTGYFGCMGNSGGGTASYYAACLDNRISVVMPSCSVCSYNVRLVIGNGPHRFYTIDAWPVFKEISGW